ncbi:MAG: mechanosensitive ion channel [Clostridia bacterium]|nr:mechanosensitive ion channel [Clostridia bacterium]
MDDTTTTESTVIINWEALRDTVQAWLLDTGIKILVALIVLFVSYKIVNFLSRRIVKSINKKLDDKRKSDKTIVNTVAYIIRIILKVVILISLISYVGIDVSGITALIATTGLGIGLAVNGALSNIAGGILLIFTRPFGEDDFINACGAEGTVEQIRLCHTVIRTPDNKVVYVPNGSLSSGTVVNFSAKPDRRVDVEFSIAFSGDFERARDIVINYCDTVEKIHKDPAPVVIITEYGESSLKLTARVWAAKEDYWDVKFDLNENIKKLFNENGIEIPFPQVDVHMK